MTSDWNLALRAAQRIIEARISSYPQHEIGQPGNMVDDSRVDGLRVALKDLKSLEHPDAPETPLLPAWIVQDMEKRLGRPSPVGGFMGLCATCDESSGRCATRILAGHGPCCDNCTHTEEKN